MPSLHTFLVLGRASNLPTVLSNTLAAWFLSGKTWSLELGLAFLASSSCYLGGMALNDVFDADWDRRHLKNRPIPAGKIRHSTALGLALALLLLGASWLWLLGGTPLLIFSLLALIILYNVVHKKVASSMWIMGACRTALFLTVASLNQSTLTTEILLWSAVLGIYVSAITLIARGEHAGQAAPTWTHLLLLSPAFVVFASLGSIAPWRGMAGFLFVMWVSFAYSNLRRQRYTMGEFVASLLAGIVLVDAACVMPACPGVGLLCIGLLPVTLLLQRMIPAT